MMKSVMEFVERTQLPVYVAPMAKGAIDESHPQFRGIFAGNCSTEEVQKEVYDADLILSIGSMNSDFNTGGFTYRLWQTKTIGKKFEHSLKPLHEYSMSHFCLSFIFRISYLSYESILCNL